MIEINLTELEQEAHRYLDMLTGNKREELRKEMIAFLKAVEWQDTYEYGVILEFVNDFFVHKSQSNTEYTSP